jgi:16S rRNA (guanine527-N7)-methyltransferase
MMDQAEFRDVLRRGATRLGVPLSDDRAALFHRYHKMLLQASQNMNLVRFKDERELIGRHYLDSLAILPHIPESVRSVVDVGTGAGLPGIPIKIVRDDLDVTLVESQAKKAGFIDDCLTQLGLSGARCICERSEDMARSPEHRETYDLAVARALAPMAIACEMCLPLVRTGGWFAAYKSAKAAQEVAEASGAIDALGGVLEGSVDLTVPLADMTTVLIVVKKAKPTPPEFPRRAGVARKRPLS